MKKAIVLLSGGIDSATVLYLAKKRKFLPTALIFDYGQRHKREIESATRIAKIARSAYRIVKLPFPEKESPLLDKKACLPTKRSFKEIKKGVPSTYVPARNLIFLSVAAAFAESVKAEAIFIGAHTEDYSGYPDCRKAFFEAFKETINLGTKYGRRIKICAPLVYKNKKEIVQLALGLEVPLEHTWSCYEGMETPCRVCDSCLFRARAFEDLGIPDPYYERG